MKLIPEGRLTNYGKYTLPKPKARYWGTIRCRNRLYAYHGMNAQRLYAGLDFYETIKAK